MSNVTRFALGLAALVSSGACVNVGGTVGSGHAKTETRSVAAFHAVDLSGSLEAEVKVGAPQKVEITGDDNLVPLVTTSVEGGKLSVQTKGSFSVKTPLKVLVVTPDLDAVDASGATTVDVSGVKADAFHVRATGANHLHVTGTTKKLDVEASGASAVSAEGLPADAVTVHASGACSTEVTANKSLDAHASGASHVSFAGHPADVKKDATGASSISAK